MRNTFPFRVINFKNNNNIKSMMSGNAENNKEGFCTMSTFTYPSKIRYQCHSTPHYIATTSLIKLKEISQNSKIQCAKLYIGLRSSSKIYMVHWNRLYKNCII